MPHFVGRVNSIMSPSCVPSAHRRVCVVLAVLQLGGMLNPLDHTHALCGIVFKQVPFSNGLFSGDSHYTTRESTLNGFIMRISGS